MKTLFTLTVALLLTVTANTFAQTKIMDATLTANGELNLYLTAATGITDIKVEVGSAPDSADIYNTTLPLAGFTVTDNVLTKNIGSVPSGSYAKIIITLSSGEKLDIEKEVE